MATDAQSEARLNNFDSIRLVAALFVIITHSFAFLGLPEHDSLHFLSRGFLSFSRLGLYTFFALSGYLVCGSLMRSPSLAQFFRNRTLRIFPGLIAVVLLTVFVFGPLVSQLPLTEYFSRSETWKYLQTLTMYRVEYVLPGVFEHNKYPFAVNGSLWTLAYEFTLYFVLAGLSFFSKKRLPFVVLGALCLMLVARIFHFEALSAITLPIARLNLGHMLNFGMYFLIGAAFSFAPTAIFRSWLIVLTALAATIISFWTPYSPLFLYITIPALLLALAYAPTPLFRKLSASGDYSYGFYIYAFPIGQMIASQLPTGSSPAFLALLTVLVTAPLAITSWHLIEKPALALKSKKH